jgi:hypothetical protein
MATAPKVFQFKLVLLGDSAVGKSSLVLRFVRGQFFEYQEATIGGPQHSLSRACTLARGSSHETHVLLTVNGCMSRGNPCRSGADFAPLVFRLHRP